MNIKANFLSGIFRNKNRNILIGNEKIVRSKPVLSLKNLFKRKKLLISSRITKYKYFNLIIKTL